MVVHPYENRLLHLKHLLARLGFINLFIVALLGLTLRGFSFSNPSFDYGKLLHGHSHFAFGGWLMPMMIWLVLQYFPSVVNRIAFHHWRNIALMVLVSAYGMLLSFPVQGYGMVSIFFSTLSVLAGFYLAFHLLKALEEEKEKPAVKFLRWGLIYMVISSVGAFATAPIIAAGLQGSWLYYDAVYFYLHFQYNGWLVFTVLAVLYRLLEIENVSNGKKVFYLFNLAALPTYFLSTLWNHPPAVFFWIGGIGALLQLAGMVYLVKDFFLLPESNRFVKGVLLLAMLAFVLKIVLQAMSALPFIAGLAYQHRNLVIAYLHLVLLGFVSLFVMALVMRNVVAGVSHSFRKSLVIFIAGFMLTEALLVANGLELIVTDAGWLLFVTSLLLVFGAYGMSLSLWRAGYLSLDLWRLKKFEEYNKHEKKESSHKEDSFISC